MLSAFLNISIYREHQDPSAPLERMEPTVCQDLSDPLDLVVVVERTVPLWVKRQLSHFSHEMPPPYLPHRRKSFFHANFTGRTPTHWEKLHIQSQSPNSRCNPSCCWLVWRSAASGAFLCAIWCDALTHTTVYIHQSYLYPFFPHSVYVGWVIA